MWDDEDGQEGKVAYSYLGGITAELLDVILNPLKRETLIQQSRVLLPSRDLGRVGESEDYG